MTSRDRLIGLGLVWLVYAILLAIIFDEGAATISASAPFMVFLTIITLAASIIVTRAAPPAAAQDQRQSSARAARDSDLIAADPKAKRSDLALVDRLIESMSDSELEALRRRLDQGGSAIGADGELLGNGMDLEQLRRAR